jgi:hypothetical protein
MSQYHTTLGVSPEASQDHIKAVYRGLVKIYHPDVPVTGNAAKFREIDDAYKILTGQAQPPRSRPSSPTTTPKSDKVLEGVYKVFVTRDEQRRGVIRARIDRHPFTFRVTDVLKHPFGSTLTATNRQGITADFVFEFEPPKPSVWKSFKETFMPTW